MAQPYSLIAKRGHFASKHLWVTPHQDKERYPAGDWVLQSKGGEGLETWVKQVRAGTCFRFKMFIGYSSV